MKRRNLILALVLVVGTPACAQQPVPQASAYCGSSVEFTHKERENQLRNIAAVRQKCRVGDPILVEPTASWIGLLCDFTKAIVLFPPPAGSPVVDSRVAQEMTRIMGEPGYAICVLADQRSTR
jgi:hypothetical protein